MQRSRLDNTGTAKRFPIPRPLPRTRPRSRTRTLPRPLQPWPVIRPLEPVPVPRLSPHGVRRNYLRQTGAVTIQKSLRMTLARRVLKQKYAAVVKIQRARKRIVARRKYKQKVRMVTVIQSLARRFKVLMAVSRRSTASSKSPGRTRRSRRWGEIRTPVGLKANIDENGGLSKEVRLNKLPLHTNTYKIQSARVTSRPVNTRGHSYPLPQDQNGKDLDSILARHFETISTPQEACSNPLPA